jgi:hypothetical protein
MAIMTFDNYNDSRSDRYLHHAGRTSVVRYNQECKKTHTWREPDSQYAVQRAYIIVCIIARRIIGVLNVGKHILIVAYTY